MPNAFEDQNATYDYPDVNAENVERGLKGANPPSIPAANPFVNPASPQPWLQPLGPTETMTNWGEFPEVAQVETQGLAAPDTQAAEAMGALGLQGLNSLVTG